MLRSTRYVLSPVVPLFGLGPTTRPYVPWVVSPSLWGLSGAFTRERVRALTVHGTRNKLEDQGAVTTEATDLGP